MGTAILGLTTGVASAKLSAVKYNQGLYSEDRLARVLAYPNNGGVIAGLQLTAAKSTVTSGQVILGPFYASFTGSQAISGLTAGVGTRRYIYARADGGSPASGTVDIVARTTSAALLNPDGITYAARLGYVVMSTNTVSGVYNSGSVAFPRSKPWTITKGAFTRAGLTGATTAPTVTKDLRWSGALMQSRTRTVSVSGGVVLALAATGAWASVGSGGGTASPSVTKDLRFSGAVLQYRTRTVVVTKGIVTATATTGAWTAVPTV